MLAMRAPAATALFDLAYRTAGAVGTRRGATAAARGAVGRYGGLAGRSPTGLAAEGLHVRIIDPSPPASKRHSLIPGDGTESTVLETRRAGDRRGSAIVPAPTTTCAHPPTRGCQHRSCSRCCGRTTTTRCWPTTTPTSGMRCRARSSPTNARRTADVAAAAALPGEPAQRGRGLGRRADRPLHNAAACAPPATSERAPRPRAGPADARGRIDRPGGVAPGRSCRTRRPPRTIPPRVWRCWMAATANARQAAAQTTSRSPKATRIQFAAASAQHGDGRDDCGQPARAALCALAASAATRW